MATKSQQLHKLTKVRDTLLKFKLCVKNVNPILENLLQRNKPPLDAKLLREIDCMLQHRQYLKSSRLQTIETDREICQLLEDLHTAFSSSTSAPPSEAHTKQHPNKVTTPAPNPKKRKAATLSSSEPQTKRRRPASSPRAAKDHRLSDKPSRQVAKAPVPPPPLISKVKKEVVQCKDEGKRKTEEKDAKTEASIQRRRP